MSKALVTFAIGDYRQFLDISRPSFMAYAAEHGYDYGEIEADSPLIAYERAPSWSKVPVLLDALAHYDEVLWVDCDAVIVNGNVDIASLVPGEAWQALAVHTTHQGFDMGEVPSCGTWFLRKPMTGYLEQAWRMTQYLDHMWWEQAAMHELLGYVHSPDIFPVQRGPETALRARTHFLAYEWASVDYLDPHAKARIMHVPQTSTFAGRLEYMRLWASVAAKHEAVRAHHEWLSHVEGELV